MGDKGASTGPGRSPAWRVTRGTTTAVEETSLNVRSSIPAGHVGNGVSSFGYYAQEGLPNLGGLLRGIR